MSDWKTPFDDDGHTLHDGPLSRFFRMRKWFFSVGALILLIDTHWWDVGATTRALALSSLPTSLVHAALTATGIYLLFQSALVVLQIGLTYSETVAARARIIKAEAAAQLREAASRQEESLGTLALEARSLAFAYGSMSRKQVVDVLPPHEIRSIVAELDGWMTEVERYIGKMGIDPTDPEAVFRNELSRRGLPVASRAVYAACRRYLLAMEMRAQANAMQRHGSALVLITSEVILDAMRIVPTLAFLVYGLFVHGDLSGFAEM